MTNTSKTVLPVTTTTSTTSEITFPTNSKKSIIDQVRSKMTIKGVLGSLLAIGATILMVLSCISGSFVQRGFVQIMHFIQEVNVFAGSLFFIAFDTLTVVLVLPGTPGNLAAGYIFGTFVGSLVSILGITFGAVAAFWLGRTLMRSWALQKMEAYPKFKAIDRAIADNAFLLIFLMRFSPLMPFAICCYMLGATRVSSLTYALASLFGLAIPTAAYCHLGSLMKDLSSMWEKGGENKNNSFTYVAVFAAATVLLVVLITYITKRALENAIKKSEVAQEALSDSPSPASPDGPRLGSDCAASPVAATVANAVELGKIMSPKNKFVLSSIVVVDNDGDFAVAPNHEVFRDSDLDE